MNTDTQSTKRAAIAAIRDIAMADGGEPIRAAAAKAINVIAPPKPRVVAPAATKAATKAASNALARKGAKSKTRPARRAVGGKRDPKVVAALTERLLAHIVAHPGQRMEQITKALGAKTAELALPIKHLIESKQLKKTGARRTTAYTATAAGAKPKKTANGVAAKAPEADAAPAPAN